MWITLDPQAGHQQAGRRPALLLSPAIYNGAVGHALLCPITSRIKGYPFEVPLPEGLAISGVPLADQIKCLDWRARKASFICSIPEKTVPHVIHKLLAILKNTA